jgi:hypothetical protein
MSQFLSRLEIILTGNVPAKSQLDQWLRQLQLSKGEDNLTRGWIDPVTQQKKLLSEITHDDFVAGSILKGPLNHKTLECLRRIVACYPQSLLSLGIFIAAHKIINRSALEVLRAHCRPQLLVHISCEQRLHLALESVASFENLPGQNHAQIIVIGSDDVPPLDYEFDPASRVLKLGCGDNYESLPDKVFLTYFILSQVADIDLVLKLDDDHQLREQQQFETFLEQIAADEGEFFGHAISINNPMGNNRCWHMGKCEAEALNRSPASFLAPAMWLNGADGYLLKKTALVKLALIFVSCEDEIRHAIYEDILVAEALARLSVTPCDVSTLPKGFDSVV